MIRRIATTMLLALLATDSALAEPLKMGVRKDAKPFVYSDGAGYAGFMYDVCTASLKKAGLEWEDKVITASQREPRLGPEGDLDLLCDPFTVTQARARDFLLSQIVFVSGGSFLSSRARLNQSARWAQQRVQALQALKEKRIFDHLGHRVEFTNNGRISESYAVDIRQTKVVKCDPEIPRVESIRIGVVESSTASLIINNVLAIEGQKIIPHKPYETVCYYEYPKHDEGVKAMCVDDSDETKAPLSYYFGDRDIIVAHLEDLRKEDIDCDVSASDRFFSVEPYAIAFSERMKSVDIRAVQSGLLAAFTEVTSLPDRGGQSVTQPVAWFVNHFNGKSMSPTLRTLFKLLIVPEGSQADNVSVPLDVGLDPTR